MKPIFFATTILAGLASGPALAQSASSQEPLAEPLAVDDGDGIEEIVVTAQQRSESLQRAAISVTALSSDTLQKSGVNDVTALTNLVPSFRASNSNGPYQQFSLRGISNFTTNSLQDNGIVINISGVPLARPTGANGLFYDIERIEVLKGPQGILYGRNATGGVVNIIPKKPGEVLAGDFSVSAGNFNLVTLNGGIDIPLSDTLTTRAAVQVVRRDGYYDDGTGDADNVSGRFTIAFKPSTTFDVSLVGDWSRDRGRGPGSSLFYSTHSSESGWVAGPWAGYFSTDPAVLAQWVAIGAAPRLAANAFQDNEYWGVTLTVNAHFSFADLTAILAHRVVNQDYQNSVPTFYQGEDTNSHQNSAEIRLASTGDGAFQWLIGGFAMKEVGHVQQLNEQGTGLSNSDINFHNDSFGVFGQATYAIVPSFRLVGGLRYSYDRKDSYSPRYTIANYPFATVPLYPRVPVGSGTFAGIVDLDKHWDAVTWKGGVEYDAGPESLIYANVSRGYKAGGFSYGPPGGNQYDPEYVTAYSLGSKNRFFDRALQVNVELFYMKYTDQQLQHFALLPGLGNFTITENIGRSHIYGGEWDVIYRLTRNTRLNFSGQYLKGVYDEFTYISPTNQALSQTCPQTVVSDGYQVDCSGRPLVSAPKWVIQGGISHRIQLTPGGSIDLDLSTRYESSKETRIAYLPETHVPGFMKSDASITYNFPGDQISISAWIKNIEDKIIKAVVLPGRSFSTVTGGIVGASLEPPRTFGLRLSGRF